MMPPDVPLTPPGDVPKNFIFACIIPCTKASREAVTNAMNIFGAFNCAGVKVDCEKIYTRDMIDEMELLPVPIGNLYIRFSTNGPTSLTWTLFSRILLWNGEPLSEDTVRPIARGDMKIGQEHNGMGEACIPVLGPGFKLTKERRSLLSPGKQLSIQTRYELWCGSDFVVAHSVDFRYTIGKEGADGNALVQSPGAK